MAPTKITLAELKIQSLNELLNEQQAQATKGGYVSSSGKITTTKGGVTGVDVRRDLWEGLFNTPKQHNTGGSGHGGTGKGGL